MLHCWLKSSLVWDLLRLIQTRLPNSYALIAIYNQSQPSCRPPPPPPPLPREMKVNLLIQCSPNSPLMGTIEQGNFVAKETYLLIFCTKKTLFVKKYSHVASKSSPTTTPQRKLRRIAFRDVNDFIQILAEWFRKLYN